MNYITTIIDRLKIELEQAGEDALWASDMQNAIAFMSSLYLNHPETVVKITREVNEAETKKLIEEVRRDSAVCLDWCKDIRSVAAARQCAATRGIEIEVNGENCNSRKFDDLKDSDIEYIRINDFGRVGYFYFFSDSGNVSFDVFPSGHELAVVNDVTLENFEEKLLSWNKERAEDELKELFPEKTSAMSIAFTEEDRVTPVNLSRYLFSEGAYPSPVAAEAIIGHYEDINRTLYEKDGKLFTVSGTDSATTTSPVTVEEIVSEFKNWRENEAKISPDDHELLEYAREFDSDIHGKVFYNPIQLENQKPDFETFFKFMQEFYPDVTKSEASAFLKFGAPETDATCQVSFHDGYFYYNTSSDDDGWTFMGDIRDFLNHAATRICDLLEYDDGDGVSIAAFLVRHPDAFMPSLRDSLDKVLNENTYNQDGVSLDYAFPEYNDDSRIREELGLADAEPLTVYEEPRWHFRDTDKALEIIKTASPDLYNEIIEFRNSLSEEDKKTLYIDFGLSIRYDDGELDGTDWHSKCPAADDMFADGFIVRYNARDNDGNVPNPAEGIDLSERTGLPWRNRFLDMAREHIQKNIDAYGEFIKLRDEAIGNQLSSPSVEPSITEAGPSVDDTGIRHFTVTYPQLTAELGNLLNLDHSVPGHPDCTANYGISQSFAVSERDGSIISKGTIMLTKDYVDESGNGNPVLIYREPFRPGPVSVRRLIEDWTEGAIRKEFPGPDKVREPSTPSFVELGVWLKENISDEDYDSFKAFFNESVMEDLSYLNLNALWSFSELEKFKADWLEIREGEQANLHDATPGDISAFLSKTGNSRFFSESLMNEVLRISDEEAAPMVMSDDGRLFIVSDGYHKRTPEELYEDILLKFDSILSGGMGTLSEEERIEYENYRKEFIDKYAEATVSVNEGPIDALLNLPSSERDPVTVFTTCLKANVSSGLSLLDAGKAAVGTCRNVFDEKQMDKLQLFLSRNIDVLDDKHFNSFFDDIISGRFVPERKISGSVKNRNYEGIDR